MRAYRAALVWALRGVALMAVALAGLAYFEASSAYERARGRLSAAELAGLVEPMQMLPQLLLVTGCAVLVCLTLAEILALLSTRD